MKRAGLCVDFNSRNAPAENIYNGDQRPRGEGGRITRGRWRAHAHCTDFFQSAKFLIMTTAALVPETYLCVLFWILDISITGLQKNVEWPSSGGNFFCAKAIDPIHILFPGIWLRNVISSAYPFRITVIFETIRIFLRSISAIERKRAKLKKQNSISYKTITFLPIDLKYRNSLRRRDKSVLFFRLDSQVPAVYRLEIKSLPRCKVFKFNHKLSRFHRREETSTGCFGTGLLIVPLL